MVNKKKVRRLLWKLLHPTSRNSQGSLYLNWHILKLFDGLRWRNQRMKSRMSATYYGCDIGQLHGRNVLPTGSSSSPEHTAGAQHGESLH